MITNACKNERRVRVHERIRNKITGSASRPRMCVFRSLKHFSVQVIDDTSGKVLLSASTNDKALREKFKQGGNIDAATRIGTIIAEGALDKGIRQVVMDRGGYLYHGRVKAFAEAARKAGLEF